MTAIRILSVCNAGWLKKCCAVIEGTLALFNPRLKTSGHHRLDRTFTAAVGALSGFLFDAQSCGHCTLGETGMAYRTANRISEIVFRSGTLGGREPWRPAP
tara:strand:- start:1201 stop:1503 length:303 start_codon:yes stop_codon:yes gene_type:complete